MLNIRHFTLCDKVQQNSGCDIIQTKLQIDLSYNAQIMKRIVTYLVKTSVAMYDKKWSFKAKIDKIITEHSTE